MGSDPELRVHKEWIGFVQPVGLVVSPPALVAAQMAPNRNIVPDHRRFLDLVAEVPVFGRDEPVQAIRNLPGLICDVLGWERTDLVGLPDGDPLPDSLEVVLPEYDETLRPTYAVPKAPGKSRDESPWLMLIQVLPINTDLDAIGETAQHRWQASPQAKFEHLLRETGVPIGLLANGAALRLVYAPKAESSGHATFPVRAMAEVAGRPMFAALKMLLEADRLFTVAEDRRLPAILAQSRKYQNEVSTKLAEQVLAALYELLRGFQAADEKRKGELLREVLQRDPNHVYAGLLTVLMRLVFLLYAEDRGLLSNDRVYVNFYSLTGLFDRLRSDADRHPDTMDQRHGAWAQLLTLFRLIHDGGGHGGLQIPARRGYLFDPDRYPFLEGRPTGSTSAEHDGERGRLRQRIDPPLIPDGVIHRVLRSLMVLDGERLSYRSLDVEQIGSVYERMMGFDLFVTRGRSIAIRPKKAHGAPATIDLDELLAIEPGKRAKWVQDRTDQEVTGEALKALKAAATPEEAAAALERKVAREVTPHVVPAGTMALQPSQERRKSGSHYTPRSLTEPIVRTTLRPILERLGPKPTPVQILDLKVCDPAMGSGAFLVEAGRQLGAALVRAWHDHGTVPTIPPDEDEQLHAQRIVAQRCLYGVDRNPMAADLAKLSLWLATLAKDHPFTFLDHSLRHGDSLVGLTKAQVGAFHWKPERQRDFWRGVIAKRIARATDYRREIHEAAEETLDLLLRQKLALADEALNPLRFYGDLVIAAYLSETHDVKREVRLDTLAERLSAYLQNPHDLELRKPLDEARRRLTRGEGSVTPFHWELEYPEVFDRENGGFDAIIGNPPFVGGTLIGGRLGLEYHDYLVALYPPATGLADLIAFFLRRSFSLIRRAGTFGLIATNTVAQGDTRSTGLTPIVQEGGTIYEAQRRYRWPGAAAVIVSVLHVAKTRTPVTPILDGRPAARISAFLLEGDADSTPAVLAMNKGICFLGTKIWGAGFVFEENPSKGSSSIEEMHRLVEQHPRNRDVLFRYLGAEEFNSSPTQSPGRFVIDFGEMSEDEARRWPALFAIVEERVRPVRLGNKQRNYRENWWLHANRVLEATPFLQEHGRLLTVACVSKHLSVAFVREGTIIANSMVILLLHRYADFAVIQSRIQEFWARFVGSSMKDDARYTTPCFDTFPRPLRRPLRIVADELELIGKQYYEVRSQIMVTNQEGLTATYNRFHDPDERSADILRLRELHDAMDRAVLDAYGWTDLRPTCEFLLDYEDEDDEEADAPSGRRRKKPWRYRWPDDLRDELLARLLNLNAERAEADRLSGAAASGSSPKGRRPAKPRSPRKGQPDLF